jgi:hypothetical protein
MFRSGKDVDEAEKAGSPVLVSIELPVTGSALDADVLHAARRRDICCLLMAQGTRITLELI